MHKATYFIPLAAIVFFALPSAALAQFQATTTPSATTEITPDQERSIYTQITREQMTMAPQPPDWAPQIGAEVPSQYQLYDMPPTIDVPSMRSDRYAMINGRVVIVDPGSRRVVHIIERY